MISVIIPVYNCKPYLAKCLGSVKRQSSRRWECIVVDDGSTDGSKEEAFRLTEGDGRFTVVSFTENRGLSAARNAGIEWANGDYLFFLDSDDWIEWDTFDSLLGEASVHPDVGRITADYIEHWPGASYRHSIVPIGFHAPDSPHLFASCDCDPGHSTGCLYIRKNLPELQFPHVKLFEDMICNMGLIFAGCSMFVTAKCVYHYLRHEGSLLSKKLSKEDAARERAALKALADRYGPSEEVYARCAAFLENAMRGRLEK